MRAGDTGLIGKPAARPEFLIDARIELWLAGAAVCERGAERARTVDWISGAAHGGSPSRVSGIGDHRDPAGRSRERVGTKVAARHAICPRRIGRIGEAGVRAKKTTRALAGRGSGVAAHEPAGERRFGAFRFARRLRDDVDDAGERVGAPDGGCRTTDDLDLFDRVQVRRQQIPQHDAEEIEIDRPAVEQHELCVRERAGGLTAGDVDVTGGQLNDVEARHAPQQVAVVLSGRALQLRAPQHRHRRRRVDEGRVISRRADHDSFSERRELQREPGNRDVRAGDDDVGAGRLRKADERRGHSIGARRDSCKSIRAFLA